MSNNANIIAYKRVNVRTQAVSYIVHIHDDIDETVIIVGRNEIPTDDMELLKIMIEATHREGYHAGSAEIIKNILDRVFYQSLDMFIGDTEYSNEEIFATISQDIREVFYCHKCGWESFNDVDYETSCGKCGCDGSLTETREEWYER